MPDQVVPITGLDQTGVILDTPPVALPPNAFTNAKNVRFKDGAVRKMEGEVNIFEGMTDFFTQTNVAGASIIGSLQYIAWWPSPNQTTDDRGYYIFVVENIEDTNNVVHDVYAMLPGAEFNSSMANSRPMHYHRLGTGYDRNGKWQHTLFNGGFTFIINNGEERPLYVTDAEGNTDITQLALSELPGWDSYRVNELLLSDTFEDTSSPIFDTGQLRVAGETNYVVERTVNNATNELTEGTHYTISQANNQDVITFNPGVLSPGNMVSIRFQSVNPVNVTAAIVRAFGDFLVAGNLVERVQGTSSTLSTDIAANAVTLTLVDASSFPEEGRASIAGQEFTWTSKNGNILQGIPSNAITAPVTAGAIVTINPDIIRRLTGVVRTSDVAQPGAIPNNWNPFAAGASTADEFVIADTGTVQDMVALQGNMYLYTNTSISAMRLTGNAQVPLTVQPVTDQYGALTTDAVLEYDGKHFVIGSDDIYLFGGHPGSIQSVSDQKIRRSFFQRVNPINENTANLFTLRYAARDEIWICFPTLDSAGGEADEAYIWNYRNGTWTIRTLNSVVRGDVGPIPGGGVPSAVISFSGQSGTDDIVRVGSREVQTLEVSTNAMVGHAEDDSLPELYSYRTLNTDANGVARPNLVLDAPELVEVTIGSDFYSGPNPALQEYNIVNIPDFMAGAFASGGARFRIEYTLPTANTGNNNTRVTVHANELILPGTGNRQVTGTDYATALAAHLDGLDEFQNWTITSSGNTINLRSDYAGMRELRGLDITTFTSTVEELIPMPNTFTGDGPHVFNDTFGDELFTVTRSGTEAPYTFSAITTRDTGFSGSDNITQLAFITDSTTFAAPDPFNRESGAFTFESMSGEFSLRTVPPANFINLVRENDRIPDNGVINTETTNEDGVNITRRAIQGGYTRESTDAPDPRDDTNEGVTVTIADAPSMSSFNMAVIGNSPSVVDSGGFSISTANQLVYTSSVSYASPRAYRVNDRTFLNSNCPPSVNYCTAYQGISGWNPPTNPGNDVLLNDWFHPAGSGAKTVITSWDTGGRVPNPHQSGEFIQIIYGGFGIEYANGVRLFYATSSTRPSNNEFVGFSNQGQNRLTGGTISTHTGSNIRVIIRGNESVTVQSRTFTVANTNPFGITFSWQGGGTARTTTVAAGATSPTLAGISGSTDESWTWANQTITVTGNSIGGSGTQDLRGTSGRRETTLNGVTVVSQNTSAPQTTTSGTARRQAILLPSTNGGSIGNPATASFTPNRNFYAVDWGGNNRAEWLSAYDVRTGARITGGGGGNVGSRNPPSGWTTGFESGAFPQTPTITASNITSPVAMGAVSQAVMRGVLNCGSQGCECTGLQPATATSNFGSNGIRQNGTGPANGPSIGIQGRRGRAGFGWTVPSTGRSNECGGNLNAGVSFAGDLRVYTQAPYPTNVRFILYGPNETVTVTVPRASSESYTVTNNNPFPITFSAGSINESVAADSTATFTANQEGIAWTVGTPTTTNYQFVLTNNNERPLLSGTLTHATSMVDLAGLGVGNSVSTAFSTVDNAFATFVREIEQAGATTVSSPVNLQLVRSGHGTTPTDPADLTSVRYRFDVNFDDDTTDIDVSYQTPENRDPTASDNLDNVGAVQGYVRALLGDANFNRYFIVHTNTAITVGSASSMADNEISTDKFRVEARAAPGNSYTYNGESITMPPHAALFFDIPTNMGNGGNAAQSLDAIRRGIATTNDPIAITINAGTRDPQSNGTLTPIVDSTHGIVLNGSYPNTTEGGTAITEVIRDHLRLDQSFGMLWQSDTTTPNSPMLEFTSANDGPHHITVAGVSPADSGLLATHLDFSSTQQGITTTPDPTYPEITLMPPLSEPQRPIRIMLNPLPGDMTTDRLVNTEIADIIKTRFSYDGWEIISTTDSNIGNAPSANQIRFVRRAEGEVMSGTEQHTGWRVDNITYGNTGRTLPGTAQGTDGTTVGRLNTTDFMRADSMGVVSMANPLITATGMGDNLDFRGSTAERSQPTRIMVQITNPDVTSMDPVFDTAGNLMRDDMGNVQLAAGNTQYLAFTFGGGGDYNSLDQSGSQPGTRRDAAHITNSIESRIINANRRVQVNRTTDGTGLTIIPTQFSGLANFIVGVFLNDSVDNVDRWNAIINANSADQPDIGGIPIDTSNNMGIQSTVPAPIDSTTDQQFNPGNRRPNFSSREIITTGLVSNDSIINNDFDPLRPWPTTQVNLNREYPIFASTEVNDAGTITRQTFRGADIGFLFLGETYESFIERIEMAITPEFDTEQIQSLALWGDGGSQVTFGQPIEQATLNIRMYGSNAPGSTLGRYTPGMNGEATNNYIIGDDYKIDMRIHGRFLNVRISDMIPTTDDSNPNLATDTELNVPRGISWNVSGMQADIVKGGRR